MPRVGSRREYAQAQLGSRIDVEAAQLVLVHDGWSGMNDDAPLITTYELRRDEAKGLAGEARQYRRGAFERAQPVSLRAIDAGKLLRLLASAPCVPGAYEPLMQWTDDFPCIDLAVHIRPESNMGGLVLFHTSSQGRYHAPWSITVRGESFVSPGDHLGKALAMLRKLVPPLPPLPRSSDPWAAYL